MLNAGRLDEESAAWQLYFGAWPVRDIKTNVQVQDRMMHSCCERWFSAATCEVDSCPGQNDAS